MLSSVYVKEVPELTLITSTDWIAIGSMVVTVIIVVLAAWFQVHQAKKLVEQTKQQMEAEQDLRRRQFIAQSRREWIESVRNTVIEYLLQVNHITETIGLEMGFEIEDRIRKAEKAESIRDMSNLVLPLSNKMKTLYSLQSKFELLINLNEKDAEIVFDNMKRIQQAYKTVLFQLPQLIARRDVANVRACISDLKTDNFSNIIRQHTKNLLKLEWERVKRLED